MPARRHDIDRLLESWPYRPGEVLARMIDEYPPNGEYPPDDGVAGAPTVLTVARDWRALLGG